MRVVLFVFFLLGIKGDYCAQQCPFAFIQSDFTQLPTMGLTYFGGGVSTFDIDEDGWDDLTIGISGSGYFVFKNQNGNFELWWNFPSTDDVKQCLWGDLNNDGFNDFIGLTLQGDILLFQNIGNDYFINLGESLNAQLPNQVWMGASLGDVNRDGWLDLYLGAYDDGANVFLRNTSFFNGEVSFFWDYNSLLTATAKSSFQPIWIDINQDDFSDLFVVNDFNQGNDYYQSNMNGGFQKMDEIVQLDFPVHSMSNSWSDFDLDGDMDILITDTLRTYLLENNGGSFTPVIDDANVYYWTWSALWFDKDNDFYDDLLITGNNILSNQGEVFYFKNIQGQFEECVVSQLGNSRYFAAAKWDVNNDFLYDAILAPDSGFYPRILENDLENSSAIKVRFEGVWSNRNAVGLKYNSYSNGMIKTGQIFSGENYLSQNSQNLILPIASNYSLIDSLVVVWPSGIREKWMNLDENQYFLLQEGSSGWYNHTTELILCPGDSIYFSMPNLMLSLNTDLVFFDSLLFTETGNYSILTRTAYGLTKSMNVEIAESIYGFDMDVVSTTCTDTVGVQLICLDDNGFEVDSINYYGSVSDFDQVVFISPDGCFYNYALDELELFNHPIYLGQSDTICWNDTLVLNDVFVVPDAGIWYVNELQSEYLFSGDNAVSFESETGCLWDTVIVVTTYPISEPLLSTFFGDSCTWFYLSNEEFTSVIWNNQWVTDSLCLIEYSGDLSYSAIDNFGCLSEGNSLVQTVSIDTGNISNDCLSREIWDLQGRCLAVYKDCNAPLTDLNYKGYYQLVLIREMFESGQRTYLMLIGL